MLARLGFTTTARRLAPEISRMNKYGPYVTKAIEGEIAIAERRHSQARALLYDVLKGTRRQGRQEFLTASQMLARLLETDGQLTEAITLLEDAEGERLKNDSWLWLEIEEQLARVYRKAGRTADAARIESQLRRLLACADPDHPSLRRLYPYAQPR